MTHIVFFVIDKILHGRMGVMLKPVRVVCKTSSLVSFLNQIPIYPRIAELAGKSYQNNNLISLTTNKITFLLPKSFFILLSISLSGNV